MLGCDISHGYEPNCNSSNVRRLIINLQHKLMSIQICSLLHKARLEGLQLVSHIAGYRYMSKNRVVTARVNVAEWSNATDSKSVGETRAGSNPAVHDHPFSLP